MSNKKIIKPLLAKDVGAAKVSALADRPNDASRFGQGGLTAAGLKAWFDKYPELVSGKLKEIVSVLAGEDAAKYITLDGSVGEVDCLYDFLALFGERGTEFDSRNISDYIETLYHKENESEDKSYSLREIVADVMARFSEVGGSLIKNGGYDFANRKVILSSGDGKKTVEISLERLVMALEASIKEVNNRIPAITPAAEGRYLQIINGEIGISEEAYIPPKLYQPVISKISSKGRVVSWTQNPSNGAFATSRNRIFIDGVLFAETSEESFDFSAAVAPAVKGKYNAQIGVSALADGFLESAVAEGRWGFSDGDEDGIEAKVNDDGITTVYAYMKDSADVTVPSYIDGDAIEEVYLWPYNSNSGVHVGSVQLICGVMYLGIGGDELTIDRLFFPYAESCSVEEGVVINRLYTTNNIPKGMEDVVGYVPRTNGTPRYKRINTACVGVGSDGDYEWAYKSSGGARLTQCKYGEEHFNGNGVLVLPNLVDGTPVVEIGKYFAAENGYITELEICNTVTAINEGAFRNCGNLALVTFGKMLKSIGNHAFRYTDVSQVDLSGCSMLDSIGGQAFANCTSLEQVTLPASVTSIGTTAFASCPNLANIYVGFGEGEVAGAPWGATGADIHYNSEV